MQQKAPDEHAWAQRQTEHTLRLLHGSEPRSERRDQDVALRSQQLLPSMTRLDGMLYGLDVDEDHPRGCWRRTTMDRCQAPSDTWSIIIDFDRLSADENTGWLPCGQWTLPPKHEKALIQLRNDAGSKYVLREWDLKSCVEVIDQSFSMTACASSEVSWLDEDTILLMGTLDGSDDMTLLGQPRTVRLWKRGTTADCATVVFAVPMDHVCARAFRDWGAVDERIVYVDKKSFETIAVHIGGRDGNQKQLPIPKTAACVLRGDYIAIRLKEDWLVHGVTYNAGLVVGSSIRDLSMAIPRLFTLCDASGFQDAVMDRNHLVMLFCHNFQYSLRVFQLGQSWSETLTHRLPAGEVMSIATLDYFASETDDALLLNAQGPLIPATSWISPIPGGRYNFVRQASTTFEAPGYRVTNHYTTNRQNESISFILVAPQQSRVEQPTCVIMCATDLIPCYSTNVGRHWLEHGGAVVFVPSSYDDAESAFMDVTSIIVNLVVNGLAIPNRTAILGAYEHGAALIERYPISDQTFAAFCAYNPRWSSAAAFGQAGRHIGPHAGEFERSLLISCDDFSDASDIQRAHQIGATLQRFEYETYYYESGLDAANSAASSDNLLAGQLRFLGQKIDWS